MPSLNDKTYAMIGVGVIALIVVLVKWAIEYTLKKVERKLDERDREREEDALLSMKGQQIICDCLHEIIYCQVNGTHNGGLEQVSKELEEYRAENRNITLKKAAKYNLQR